MPLEKQIWSTDIIDNVYKNNEFATRCVNRDGDVIGEGTVVHTAVAGNPAQTKKNLTTFPQTATVRQDAESTYALDAIYSLPRRVPNLDKYQFSYDKRQSVVGEDNKKLIQDAMDNLLWRWAPTSDAQIIKATGQNTSKELIDSTATGERSTFTKDDLMVAVKSLANNDFSPFNKVALLTAYHYYQFFDSLSEGEKTAFNNVADVKNGIVGRYMGVDVLMRSSVLRYREVGGVLVPVDSLDDNYAPQAGDCAASLIYTENSVERALGMVDTFDNPGQALYYGDIFSAMMYFGGRQRRPKGVFAIVEDAA